jgi:PAS domain S-box-containing protein
VTFVVLLGKEQYRYSVMEDRPLRLLMAEDSEDDAQLLVYELQRGGFAVDFQRVATPEAMRAALAECAWDVITSDHAMPAFSAPAALALAKEFCPDTPFIIVSGEMDLNLAVSLMRSGAQDYIQKRELPLLAPTIERELAEVEVRRQRQKADEERRISEEKFYKAFQNSPDAINLTRLSDGVYLEVNEGTERLSGYSAAEILGKSTLGLNIWADPQQRVRLNQKLLNTGKLENEEVNVRNRSGQIFPSSISARVITINGEACVITFTRDIREQKRAEEEIRRQNRELQAASELIQQHAAELEERVADRTAELRAINQELEAFTNTIAHDLRAPLRAISSYSQILLEDNLQQLDADGQTYLKRIILVTQRMSHLIDDLLAFSRLSKAEINYGPVDLTQLARTIAEELQEQQPERQAIWHIADGLLVTGDENLLRTALENLLGNAWKFSVYQPRTQIEVGVQEIAEEKIYFVRDNGAGFDPQHANHLFGMLQRLHNNNEFPGNGIGLTSVKRIIERHGGRIWAEGQVNRGATFYFTLPLIK